MRRTFVLSRTPFAASLLALSLAAPALAQTEQADTGQGATEEATTGQAEAGTAGQADEAVAAPQSDVTEPDQPGAADQGDEAEAAVDEAEAAAVEETGQAGDIDDEVTGQAGDVGEAGEADPPGMAGEPGAAQPGDEALPPEIQQTMRQLEPQLTPAQMEAVRAMMMQMAQTGAADAQDLGAAVEPGQIGQVDLPGGTDALEAADADMPGAATTGRMSDMAEAVGPDNRTVMLDIEGFSQTIYERGFRQGYIRGISDARNRFIGQLEQMRQRGRLGADRGAAGTGAQAGRVSPDTVGEAQPSPVPSGATPPPGYEPEGDERGTVIVLPPGVSPQAFIEQMMRANEAGQQQQ